MSERLLFIDDPQRPAKRRVRVLFKRNMFAFQRGFKVELATKPLSVRVALCDSLSAVKKVGRTVGESRPIVD